VNTLGSTLRILLGTAALAAALPGFFRQRVTLENAEKGLARLLDSRARTFLDLVRAEIFESADSPYRALFTHAGCTFADLEAGVRRDGLEPTLERLAREGVFLTSDEFGGRTPTIRGSLVLQVTPGAFERRGPMPGYALESSGSRGAPVRSFSPLDWRGLQTLGEAVFFATHDLYACVHALYEPLVTGRITTLLINGRLGVPTDRWFALRVRAHGPAEIRYHHINARLVAALGRHFGPGIADPTPVDPGDVIPILRWIAANQQSGRRSAVRTVVSNATRIARAALDAGVPLEGVVFWASGEPLTPTRKQLIEASGARVALQYGPGGGLATALGCGRPDAIDDMHLPLMLWTAVSHPVPLDLPGPPVHPLLFTTLHPFAPRLLVNVGNGDHATITSRDCGCPLHRAGLTRHVHAVRSFEKLTGEGMNYFGSALHDLVERVLPSAFGGGPGDYQLVEEEDDRGQARITLVVDPVVGPLDEARVLEQMQETLAAGSRSSRFMTAIWQDAGAFRIRRETPHASARGKVLALRVHRGATRHVPR
jgi:hypothetical protein